MMASVDTTKKLLSPLEAFVPLIVTRMKVLAVVSGKKLEFAAISSMHGIVQKLVTSAMHYIKSVSVSMRIIAIE